jgi:hypothetical protein
MIIFRLTPFQCCVIIKHHRECFRDPAQPRARKKADEPMRLKKKGSRTTVLNDRIGIINQHDHQQ